ncbi:lipoprotein insertase outer membrane protein LolB [Accumulibacter sp.]|uniref:lipoprotein insertase outer membrane protein LolB n=1 Tax=Accumulibacter sp. TaxID=2053492 RepID=UPI0025CCA428|nr:lipoprotein insertase outer membrane protein LolB [Accumulibacter sp.]MCM8595923.1 lipoprotein insertase outer membrane protein LolB [Accumulibacter sp.]MCM8627117.1 lipoprotein insertase outer membrane protein LolB [Accumulibacter sp.]MDS4050072.1 lipoprotein insertase outer membrane protein LolB [Accumulibacter sp.]
MSPSPAALLSTVLLVGVLAAGGCAPLPAARPEAPIPVTSPRERLDAFALSGRFSLTAGNRNQSGRIDWQHDESGDTLLISSPFGQAVAEISGDASGARLATSDGRTETAASTDELLQSVLDSPPPLDQLIDWLGGRAAPGSTIAVDGHGRPLRVAHQDWRVDYEYDSEDPGALPARVFVEREGGFTLRLRIDEWQKASSREGDRR